ncbi:MAG: hypothetical protein FWD94_04895 [Treponema sp.]|nr:hypothetical protein [Treponema sp.]
MILEPANVVPDAEGRKNFLLNDGITLIIGIFCGQQLGRFFVGGSSAFFHAFLEAVLWLLLFRFRKNRIGFLCAFLGILLIRIPLTLDPALFRNLGIEYAMNGWVLLAALAVIGAFVMLYQRKDPGSLPKNQRITFLASTVAGVYGMFALLALNFVQTVSGLFAAVLCLLFAQWRKIPLLVGSCVFILVDIGIRNGPWKPLDEEGMQKLSEMDSPIVSGILAEFGAIKMLLLFSFIVLSIVVALCNRKKVRPGRNLDTGESFAD